MEPGERAVSPARQRGRRGLEKSLAEPRRAELCWRSPPGAGLRLQWPGRLFRHEGEASLLPPTASPRVQELHGDAALRLLHGDALTLASSLHDEGLCGKVDLVYLDPPFFSEADYLVETRLDGPADGRVVRSAAYHDRWAKKQGGLGAYLDMLAPRLEALASLLAETGTFWVHLDWRAAYLVRVLLDEIMGKDAFLNEIVWRRAPNLGRQAQSGQFGRTLDTLVVYGGPSARLRPPTRLEQVPRSAVRIDEQGRPFTSAPRGDYTDASIAKLDAEGRVLRTASGRVYIKYFLVKDEDGSLCRERRVDTLWTDVPPLRHASPAERTGYPTQKPRALLERILRAGSPEGGLVVDAFAGSGTTGEAAHATGRRAILGDTGASAIATARARLLRSGAGVALETLEGARELPRLPVVGHAARAGEGAVKITLLEPSEPLAWAIDASPLVRPPFTTTWHAERTLGTKPLPVPREVVVPYAGSGDGSGGVRVRVYGDDGRVGETEIPVEIR